MGGGVARAKAKFKNGGEFTGDVPHDCSGWPKTCDESETVSVTSPISIAEKSSIMIVPFVAPEVRIGYRVAKKILLDFGITFFVMIPPQTERQPAAGGGNFQLPNDKGRQAPVGNTPGSTGALTIVDGYTTTPTSQNGPLVTLPHEDGFGVVLAIVPSIAGHFDF